MIGFTLRLLGRSFRWVAPAILYALWLLLVLTNGGPLRSNVVAVFPLHEIVLCWLAVAIGNIDDDGHRELCTAIAGSPGRLLVIRSTVALTLAVAVACLSTLVLALFSSPRPSSVSEVAAGFFAVLAGGVIGVGIGSALHRPLVRQIGVTVVVASLAITACIITPPILPLLRGVDGADDAAGFALFGIASVLALVLVGAASRFVGRFAR